MENELLLTKLDELLQTGDELALRDFVTEHIQEFPEDMKEEIVGFLFEEALTEYADTISEEEKYLKEAPETLEGLSQIKTYLEEQIKLEQVKARLKNQAN